MPRKIAGTTEAAIGPPIRVNNYGYSRPDNGCCDLEVRSTSDGPRERYNGPPACGLREFYPAVSIFGSLLQVWQGNVHQLGLAVSHPDSGRTEPGQAGVLIAGPCD